MKYELTLDPQPVFRQILTPTLLRSKKKMSNFCLESTPAPVVDHLCAEHVWLFICVILFIFSLLRVFPI